jgi:RNA polymerase sigma-70 factor (ECF subfamily)
MEEIESHLKSYLVASRPRAMAALLAYFKDLDLAEEAFQIAAARASVAWRKSGLPKDPLAWVIKVGRNAGIDELRKTRRRDVLAQEIALIGNVANHPSTESEMDARVFRDDVLRLLFLCCHPTLSPMDQMILCLRIVLGLSIADISRSFVTNTNTLQRRFTRARVRAQKLSHPQPDSLSPHSRSGQLDQVRSSLYLMFNKGYGGSHDAPHLQVSLCREAIRLSRLLLQIFPDEPETLGLLALFLGQHARSATRLDGNGALVALPDQDRTQWDKSMILEAKAVLQKAVTLLDPGPYQLQAAIAAVHLEAETADRTNWREIYRLYQALETITPTPVVTLNRITAYSQIVGPLAALEQLQGLSEPLAQYLPFQAVYAGLSEQAGDLGGALRATKAALSCAPSAEEREFLIEQQSRLRILLPNLSE